MWVVIHVFGHVFEVVIYATSYKIQILSVQVDVYSTRLAEKHQGLVQKIAAYAYITDVLISPTCFISNFPKEHNSLPVKTKRLIQLL